MRIRKRLALSSVPTAAFSDLQLQRSEAAPPPDQPSDPPKQPPDESTAIHSKNNRWVFPETEEKMKQKEKALMGCQKEHALAYERQSKDFFNVEFGDDETLRVEAKKTTNDDIRKIVNICDGEGYNRSRQPSSSSVQESCCEGEYEVVPLKTRKGSFDRNPNEETMCAKMKSKTNKKCGDVTQVDQKSVIEENGIDISLNGGGKKSKRGTVIMEGSRCSRVNGRGWRCCQPTLVGYSLCEHHLGKGRLRSMASVRRGGGGAPPRQPSDEDSKQQPPPLMMVTKKRAKVGVVKARSISSLLSQSDG